MARKQKAVRKFNGKFYVRVFSSTRKDVAERIKKRLHEQKKYGLIVKSGTAYQIWSRV